MVLPTCKCPVCHASMSLDVMLSDDSSREALAAIVAVHPQGEQFIKPLLKYVGLFAPEKSQMSHKRIATLVRELEPMIKNERIERNGQTHHAPLTRWIEGFNSVLNARDSGTLQTPLKSHGYLFTVMAQSEKQEQAHIERQREQAKHEQLRTGAQRRQDDIESLRKLPNDPVSSEKGKKNVERVKAMLSQKKALSMQDIGQNLLKNQQPPKEKQ